jgi:hypothetical protein
MTTAPDPTSWTLRLKSQKTTVLLQTNPLHTFGTIKSRLYSVLQETSLKDQNGNRIPLPGSPEDIQLGKPANINDPRDGFVPGEWEANGLQEDDEAPNPKGKGKGKPKDTEELATPSNIKNCPKGANLRDGSVLAFRWRGQGMESAWEEEDVEDDEDLVMVGGEGKSLWGVKIASFEDGYGVENTGDVGGHREFEG